MKKLFCQLAIVMLVIALNLRAEPAANIPVAPSPALHDSVILIIRHAEKPDQGFELSPAGTNRAIAYINYFKNFTIDSRPLKLDAIFAAADSEGSHRPRLTVEPLSQSLGIKIDSQFKNGDFAALANELETKDHGRQILIAWHHGHIPELLRALGADPEKLFPNGKWPEDVFNWVIELRYDSQGKLIANQAKRINENLMPGDASH